MSSLTLGTPHTTPVWCKINTQSMMNVGWSGHEAKPVPCLMMIAGANNNDADYEDDDEDADQKVFVPFSFVKKYFDVSV